MKWKNRLTNYNFWISIVSATLLILQAFNIKLDIANINEIVTALLGLLVVIGIINDPTKSAKETDESKSKDTKTVSTKHVKGCKQATNDLTGAEQDETAEICEKLTESKPEVAAKETEELDNQIVQEQPCPACEEIDEATKVDDLCLKNQIDKDCNEQFSNDLNAQTFEEILDTGTPIAEQNAADYDLIENDLQVLINQISNDIKGKYAELNKLAESLNLVTKKAENSKVASSAELQCENHKSEADEMLNNENILAENTSTNQSAEASKFVNYDEVNSNEQKVKDLKISESDDAENMQNKTAQQTEIPTHFNIVN